MLFVLCWICLYSLAAGHWISTVATLAHAGICEYSAATITSLFQQI